MHFSLSSSSSSSSSHLLSPSDPEIIASEKKNDSTPVSLAEAIYHDTNHYNTAVNLNIRLAIALLEKLSKEISQYQKSNRQETEEVDVTALHITLEEIKDCVNVALTCNRDGSKLLSNFLKLQKLNLSQLKIESKPFALNKEIFKPLFSLYNSSCKEKGITLTFPTISSEIMLKGDAFWLKEVISNLLSNAVKFAASVDKRPPQVEFSFTSEPMDGNYQLDFKIKNTGPGLDSKRIARLFIPYDQGDASTVKKFEGNGIGLTICQRLIHLMSGKIICTSSTEEQWVQFEIQLTLPAQNSLKINTTKKKLSRPKMKAKILFADDCQIMRKAYHKELLSWGCSVELAQDGNELLERFRKQQFDIIITDLNMPGKSGAKAIQEIRLLEKSTGSRTPIVGFSGDAYDREKMKGIDIDDYLMKNSSKNDLYKKVKQLVKKEDKQSDKMEEEQPPFRLFTPRKRSLASTDFSDDNNSTSSRKSSMTSFDRDLSFSSGFFTSLEYSCRGQINPVPEPSPSSSLSRRSSSNSPFPMEDSFSPYSSEPSTFTASDLEQKMGGLLNAIQVQFNHLVEQKPEQTHFFTSTERLMPKKELSDFTDDLATFYNQIESPEEKSIAISMSLGTWHTLKARAFCSKKKLLQQLVENHLQFWQKKSKEIEAILAKKPVDNQTSENNCLMM
ncbi:MAG: response regulator [Proteobacteria bacterium]|nr:response regulator [Pseudomonadota bacterium]